MRTGQSTLAKCLLHRNGLVFLKTSPSCGLPIFLKVNHQLESRMPEIGLFGSEGGALTTGVPTLSRRGGTLWASHRPPVGTPEQNGSGLRSRLPARSR